MFKSRRMKRGHVGRSRVRKGAFERLESRELLFAAPLSLSFSLEAYVPATAQEQTLADKVGYELAHLWSDWNDYESLSGAA